MPIRPDRISNAGLTFRDLGPTKTGVTDSHATSASLLAPASQTLEKNVPLQVAHKQKQPNPILSAQQLVLDNYMRKNANDFKKVPVVHITI